MITCIPSVFLLSNTSIEQEITMHLALLQRGSGVIVRAYNLSLKERMVFTQKVACVCRFLDLRLLIAVRNKADLTLAVQTGADGLHLPERIAQGQTLASILRWFRRKRGKILTIAAHRVQALIYGKHLHASVILLSPVFHTYSHMQETPIGPERFALWGRKTRIPTVALGGIRIITIRKLQSAAGIAMSFNFIQDLVFIEEKQLEIP